MSGVLHECGEGNGNFPGLVKGGETVPVSATAWFRHLVTTGTDVTLGIENNRLFPYPTCHISYAKDSQLWDGSRGPRRDQRYLEAMFPRPESRYKHPCCVSR